MIYRWRNHPRIRKWMFVSKQIAWKEHEKFWKKRLKKRNRYSYIVQVDGKDGGVIRLDPDSRNRKQYAIDVYLEPKLQGKGVGRRTIAAIKKIARKKRIKALAATVKPTNRRSQKIFEKNNFKLRHYEYRYKL